MITDVLLTGCTDFISDEFLAAAFPGCRILITGTPHVKSSSKNKISVQKGRLLDMDCRRLFNLYEFDQVIYFSRGSSPFQTINGDELEELAMLLNACTTDTRVIYITGPEHPVSDPISVLEASAREMCRRHASKTNGINVVVSSWIYDLYARQSSLTRLFEPGKHRLEIASQQEISFLAAEDLSLLLYRMFENWEWSLEPYYIPNAFTCTADWFTALIRRELRGQETEFTFSDREVYSISRETDSTLRSRFMWFPRYSMQEDLPTIVKDYLSSRRSSFYDYWNMLKQGKFLLHVLELLAGFIITELIIRLSGISVQFKMVDFRLMYVVLIGTMYNMRMGLAAAGLESISLALAYATVGTGWITLFYEPTNWLPFIAYFTAGAICGYIRDKDRTLLKFSQDETKSVTDRYNYLMKVNDDVLQEKKEYKQQIIGSRDSFGKIFDIAQRLNESHPKQLLSRAVEVIETVMSNNTVAIYSCSGQRAYGRMMVSSANLKLPYSAPMQDFYTRLETVDSGHAWVNRALDEKMPLYLYSIRKNGLIEVIILIQQADASQMSLYHENLFRVICGLISNSLLKAMEYQDAIHREKCVPGSGTILLEHYFQEELSIAIRAHEQKQAVHVLLRVERMGKSLSDMEPLLIKCVRNTDIIGLCGDAIYVLLPQAQERDMPIISRRFDAAEVRFQVVPFERQSDLI